MTSLLLALLLGGASLAPAATLTPCAVDRAAALALPPDKFDQEKGGWRPLADRPECELAAAELLADYRRAHWGTLKAYQLHANYWHEGQIRATAGQKDRAVPLLMAGVGPYPAFDFEDYALGTIAFLNRDRSGLNAARARLAAQPEPTDFEKLQQSYKAKYGFEMGWPPNLDVLDGFLQCFNKPYREAYGCRPKTEHH